MIAKNGIDWDAMGFVVYGECPEYKGWKKINRNKERNVTFTPAYKLWQRLIRVDRGQEIPNLRDNLCEQWKEFSVFEKWYEQNHYEVEGEDVEFSYRFFDIYNTYVSPETSCFLPKNINSVVKVMFRHKENGLMINVTNPKKGSYSIRKDGWNKPVVYSDSLEEILEIRKQMLRREFADFAEHYKDYLPQNIYDKLLNDDFYGEVANEQMEL